MVDMNTQVGEFVDVAHLVLTSVQTDLSLDPSKAGTEWLRLSDDEVSIAHVELNGISEVIGTHTHTHTCLLYTSPSPRDATLSRMPSSA